MEFVKITLKTGEVFTVSAETFGQFLDLKGISTSSIESIYKA
jgi:hypothetical protein